MSFKVKDYNGKTVGTFITLINQDTALVQLKINNILYILPVYVDRIGDSGNIPVYYTSMDCSGQKYIEYTPTLYPQWILTEMGWITHGIIGNISPQVVDILSQSDTDETSCNSVSFPATPVITIEQAVGPDFRAGFTAPFKFE